MSMLYGSFIFYLLVIFVIGIFAQRLTKNLSDYILGGRDLPGPVVALGAGASDMSTWLLLALPGLIFVNGINGLWVPVGLVLGAYLNWQFVARRLRVFTEMNNNALTLPAYFDQRFSDSARVLRVITALVVLLFFTFYASAGFSAAAYLLESLFGIGHGLALLLGASVIILYVFIGGFLAVSWIDFFQGVLMFIALLIVPVATFIHLGGFSGIMNHLSAQPSGYFDAFGATSSLVIISYLAWGLGYPGQPHILVRFMAARHSKEIPIAQLICMVWMIIALYCAVMTGLFGHAFYTQGLAHPEMVLVQLTKALLPSILGGIVIAGVLSSAMSATSAQLLASASAAAGDFYQLLVGKRASANSLVWVARLAVLVIGLIAMILAHSASNTIYALVSYAWAGLGASFGPIVILSLYWRQMTTQGAIAGMIVGAATVIIWTLMGNHYHGIFDLYAIVPGFILNLIVSVCVSRLSGSPSEEVLKGFDRALESYRQGRV